MPTSTDSATPPAERPQPSERAATAERAAPAERPPPAERPAPDGWVAPEVASSAAPGRRISVIGSSCSGKTTMSAGLAQALGLCHVEMDSLFHGPGWTPRPWPIVKAVVSQVTDGDHWVVDGNYSEVRPVVWPRADTVVWLDYRLSIILWRLFNRTGRRILLREELWNGNREDLRSFLFSRDSLLLWIFQTYWRRKRQYPMVLAEPQHAHLSLVHLTTPRAADEWLKAVRRHAAGDAS